MNYLAHAYLSGTDDRILIGNMLGDFIKGPHNPGFDPKIWEGIRLHRHIDSFTDTDQIIIETKKVYRPSVGRYDGAFLDISFDYFLIQSPNYIPDGGWKFFTERCYDVIQKYWDILPPASHDLFYYMLQDDWLYNYRLDSHIERSFNGMIRRLKYVSDEAKPYALFLKNKSYLKNRFEEFFSKVKLMASEFITKDLL